MKSRSLLYLLPFVLFASIPAMHAQTFRVIHSFTGRGGEGLNPVGGVTIRGNTLYGTTWPPCGTVYEVTNTGSTWLFSTLAPLPRNCGPISRVVFGPDDQLYGTSDKGGRYGYGYGTVFKLTSPVGICVTAACYWKVSDLWDFGSGNDGQYPGYGDLIWDQQGNIYGTTAYGGSLNCYSGCGIVYELTPWGNGYQEEVLYSFSGGADGVLPTSGVILDQQRNLFGTTQSGGSNNAGTVFELSYDRRAGWTEHVLYNFQNATDGLGPIGGLILDASGNLYGSTFAGGSGGGGTIFELSRSGSTWVFKLLHSFSAEGYWLGPMAAFSMDQAGNLYGTTTGGGVYGFGSVFKLSNTENGWVYTSLHDFRGDSEGRTPIGSVAIDSDGTLYGTTEEGGIIDQYPCTEYAFGCGTVWMIKP